MRTTLALVVLAATQAFAHVRVDFDVDLEAYAARLSNISATQVSSSVLATTQSSLTAVVGLIGFPSCDYSAALNFGGTQVYLTIDTGSSNNAVASSTCSCGLNGAGFPGNPNAPNQFTSNYGTSNDAASWTGYLTQTTSTVIGSGALTQTTFQADVSVILSQSNFFRSQCLGFTQGILGLAYAGIAQQNSISYTDSLAAAGVPDAFALQFCPPAFSPTPQQRSGNWWIGGFPSSQLAEPMQFTAITDQKWYVVQMSGVKIGGTSLSLVGLDTALEIVDSGTSELVFTEENYQTILAAVQNANPVTIDSQYGSTSDLYNGYQLTVPLTAITFNENAILNIEFPSTSGGTFSVPIHPQEYFFVSQPTDSSSEYGAGYVTIAFGISSSGAYSQDGEVGTILGAPIHLNKMVYYDRNQNKRIGFATTNPAGCVYTGASGIPVPDASEIDVIWPSTSSGNVGTPAPSPSSSPSAPSPSSSQAASPSHSPAVSPSHSPAVSPSQTPAVSPSQSPEVIPSVTPAVSSSQSPEVIPSVTPAVSSSQSPASSQSASISANPVPSSSPSHVAASVASSRSPSSSPSISSEVPVRSPSASASPSNTPKSPSPSSSHLPPGVSRSPSSSPSKLPSPSSSSSGNVISSQTISTATLTSTTTNNSPSPTSGVYVPPPVATPSGSASPSSNYSKKNAGSPTVSSGSFSTTVLVTVAAFLIWIA